MEFEKAWERFKIFNPQLNKAHNVVMTVEELRELLKVFHEVGRTLEFTGKPLKVHSTTG